MTEIDNQSPPILICGMHRSGTSMVAQLLARAGLYLGEDDDLMDAHPEDNPDGYWEYNKIIEFSDQLLKKVGGSWDNPNPIQTNRWLNKINLAEEQEKAFEILSPLMKTERKWGWKDPRATVMLPFWRSIFPGLRIIICLRNPIEVAYSLSKRHTAHVDFDKGLTLWRDYHEILKRDFQEIPSIVTHFESSFYKPNEEISRLCEFIGMPISPDQISKSTKSIKPQLYRGVATWNLLNRFEHLPLGLLEIYKHFINQAGKVFDELKEVNQNRKNQSEMALEKLITTSTETFDQYNWVIQSLKTKTIELTFTTKELNSQLSDQNEITDQMKNDLQKKIQKLTADLANRDQSIQKLTADLANRDQSIQKLTADLANRNQSIQKLTADLANRNQSIQKLTADLDASEQEVMFYALSKSWKITRPLRKLVMFLKRFGIKGE